MLMIHFTELKLDLRNALLDRVNKIISLREVSKEVVPVIERFLQQVRLHVFLCMPLPPISLRITERYQYVTFNSLLCNQLEA